MTKEEIEIFKEKIKETILPAAKNMTEDQISNLIKIVQSENPDLPEGFGNMLMEQIRVMKYNEIDREKDIQTKRLF